MQDKDMATISAIADVMAVRGGNTGFDADDAWRRVLARDRGADDEFVYAVASTGIYCRPSCASKRPARENVTFFRSVGEAEASGFRACLRCKPRRAGDRVDLHSGAVERAAQMLRDGQVLSSDELAEAVGLSRFALLRGFKRILGVTPAEFARAERWKRFREEVRVKETSVTEAVYAAGFGSASRLYESSDSTLGMRPSAMKASGMGELIRWTTAESPLGLMLVASTARGLCMVLFAGNDAEAESELRDRFGKAELQRDNAGLGEAVRFVLAEMGESPSAASLPLDVRATAFQHRVWEALRAIPWGETRTYKQIAEAIGSPNAVRAVGTACGANPLAIVVPCHRAVGTDGRLHGYRWGLERKQRLLKMEREERTEK